jgi:hypothetical protein
MADRRKEFQHLICSGSISFALSSLIGRYGRTSGASTGITGCGLTTGFGLGLDAVAGVSGAKSYNSSLEMGSLMELHPKRFPPQRGVLPDYKTAGKFHWSYSKSL